MVPVPHPPLSRPCGDPDYFYSSLAVGTRTFPPRWHSTPSYSGCSFSTLQLFSLLPLCRPTPLAWWESLSIVQKYKGRSLEVQISSVALWSYWSTRGLWKVNHFQGEYPSELKNTGDPKESLEKKKREHLPAGKTRAAGWGLSFERPD